MCGRFTLTIDQEAVSAAYGVERLLFEHRPRYNIAPTQDVAVLLEGEAGRRVEAFRWGLVPGWAEDPGIGNRMINARSETVGEKPAFRSAWRRRQRCLVLADGFYEWQRPSGGRGAKVPHWIHMADRRPFGFAGLWERWEGGAEPLHTCTILTTSPNPVVAPIHDRMPVALGDPDQWNRWIDGEVLADEVQDLLAPFPPQEMNAHPVSTYVNSPRNEGPECIREAPGSSASPDLFPGE